MGKVSSYSSDSAPTTGDYLLGNQAAGPSTVRFLISTLITFFMKATNMFCDYKFSVYRNAAWTGATNAAGLVAFDSKTFDTGSNVDIVTNKGRFTVPVSGFYYFTATVGFSSRADTVAVVNYLYKNGSQLKVGGQTETAGGYVAGLNANLVQLAANDYIEIYAYASSEAGATDAGHTYFDGWLVSKT